MTKIDTFTKTAATGLVALLCFTAITFAAPVKQFEGSRAEVRAACAGEGTTLIEGASYSLCVSATSDVICDDEGICASTDLARAYATGFRQEQLATAVAQ
jgi:hypothetical protein